MINRPDATWRVKNTIHTICHHHKSFTYSKWFAAAIYIPSEQNWSFKLNPVRRTQVIAQVNGAQICNIIHFFFSIGNQSFENSILCDRNREPIGIKADDDAHTSYRGESCIHCVRGKVQNRKLCIFNAFRSRIYRECNEILCYKHMRSQTALVVVNARAVRITLGCIERMQGLYIVFDWKAVDVRRVQHARVNTLCLRLQICMILKTGMREPTTSRYKIYQLKMLYIA